MKNLDAHKYDLTFILCPRPSLRAPLARLFDGEASEADCAVLADEADFLLATYREPTHPVRVPLMALRDALKS